MKINLFLFILLFTTRDDFLLFEEREHTREMTKVSSVFFQKRKEKKAKKLCLGYQSETLKQHDLGNEAALFFTTSRVSEKYHAYEYYSTPSERETETEK